MTVTGLNKSEKPRMHFDIYAILEGPQELYFGHEVQVNVNLVEQVELELPNGERMKKCYLSPTKRRGVERRTLIWAPTQSGQLLGDRQTCGIPKACADQNCPICAVFGALTPGEKTLVGRLTHGGGVAIQTLHPAEKQRAMHPAEIVRGKNESPMPFRREYNEPGLFYPVYNHLLSVTEDEFSASAYAFLEAMARLGAGQPKGMLLHEDAHGPLLVVDKYLSPLGKRPIISPHQTHSDLAIEDFRAKAAWVNGQIHTETHITKDRFARYIGNDALLFLQNCADTFVKHHLQQG